MQRPVLIKIFVNLLIFESVDGILGCHICHCVCKKRHTRVEPNIFALQKHTAGDYRVIFISRVCCLVESDTAAYLLLGSGVVLMANQQNTLIKVGCLCSRNIF